MDHNEELGIICKFNQTGFCKFREGCNKTHNNKLCEKTNDCTEESCKQRHPKDCKNFSKDGFCRHKDKFVYKHAQPHNNQDKLHDTIIMLILGQQQNV